MLLYEAMLIDGPPHKRRRPANHSGQRDAGEKTSIFWPDAENFDWPRWAFGFTFPDFQSRTRLEFGPKMNVKGGTDAASSVRKRERVFDEEVIVTFGIGTLPLTMTVFLRKMVS
jgi:hypothetical protein